MTKSRKQRLQFTAFNIAEKHKRDGYVSLKTLSTWNRKIKPSESKGFYCKKEPNLFIKYDEP
ncbi:hypothetical protein GNP84_06605 [Aliivibrio fischeri]|uniref:hypothetical protein n=1 Tax=Aliivibrio fischeri TaxID=668 RepID=UPI0012D90FA0|nr:hypothetical protein [Aliivibrio fischeri]MUK76576.1 hypothetical protein [Aliivibrio fischeri]